MVDKLVDTFVLRGGNRNDRNAEPALHLVYADRSAVLADLVHHVECKYHRHFEFHELHRQIQVSLEVGRIDNIDNAFRLFVQNKLSRNELLARIRRH